MPESTDQIATAISAGVTGQDKPDNLTVKRPAVEALRGLLAFGAVANAVIVGVIADLTWAGWAVSTEAQRINYVGGLGVCAALCAVLTVGAFAMPTIGRVEASAGPGHISMGEERT